MRRWWKTLGVLSGAVVCAAGLVHSAAAQFPPHGGMPPGPGMGMPYGPGPGMGMPMGPGMGMPPGPGMGMPGMGMPPGPGMGMPPGPGMGMAPGMPVSNGGMPPGPFDGPPPGMAGGPPQGKESPFSMKDEGLPGAFSTLIDPRGNVGYPYCIAFRVEGLAWTISRGNNNSALATTTNGVFPAQRGALGDPSTTVLVPAGEEYYNYGTLRGPRLTLGLAIGHVPPIEISGFWFNENMNSFSGGSNNGTGGYLARPVFLVDTGVQDAFPVNNLPTLNGSLNIDSKLSFWGLDVNFLLNCIDNSTCTFDLILGYKHLDLYENLEIQSRFGGDVFFNGIAQPGTANSVLDRFRTRNAFDGFTSGLRSVFTCGRLSLITDGKISMGVTNQNLLIEGFTNSNAGVGASLPGGLLALASNSGQRSVQEFSFVPEVKITLSFQLTRHCRFFGGYDALYWSSVIRPGDHINTAIDSRQAPSAVGFNPNAGGNAPAQPGFVTRGFGAQGVHFGLEIGF